MSSGTRDWEKGSNFIKKEKSDTQQHKQVKSVLPLFNPVKGSERLRVILMPTKLILSFT